MMSTERVAIDAVNLSHNLTLEVRIKRHPEFLWRLRIGTFFLAVASFFIPLEVEVIQPRMRWRKPPAEWLDA
jgi:hypothetical protein